MRDRRARRAIALGAGLCLTAACSTSGRELPAPNTTVAPTSAALTSATAVQSGAITLASPVVAPGAVIPAAYLSATAPGPPPVQWSAPPAGTVELAVTVEDDATGVAYWIVTGLAATTVSLDAAVGLPAGAIVRPNHTGAASWSPPSPVVGALRLRFTVWALSTPLTVAATAPATEVTAAIAGNTAAKGVFKALTGAEALSGSRLTPN